MTLGPQHQPSYQGTLVMCGKGITWSAAVLRSASPSRTLHPTSHLLPTAAAPCAPQLARVDECRGECRGYEDMGIVVAQFAFGETLDDVSGDVGVLGNLAREDLLLDFLKYNAA